MCCFLPQASSAWTLAGTPVTGTGSKAALLGQRVRLRKIATPTQPMLVANSTPTRHMPSLATAFATRECTSRVRTSFTDLRQTLSATLALCKLSATKLMGTRLLLLESTASTPQRLAPLLAQEVMEVVTKTTRPGLAVEVTAFSGSVPFPSISVDVLSCTR